MPRAQPGACMHGWLSTPTSMGADKPRPGAREHEPKLSLKWSGQGEHFLAVFLVRGGCSRPEPEPGWQCGP